MHGDSTLPLSYAHEDTVSELWLGCKLASKESGTYEGAAQADEHPTDCFQYWLDKQDTVHLKSPTFDL